MKTNEEVSTYMDIKKFKRVIGPAIKKIKEEQKYLAVGSFRPLAELLIQWYERKLSEEAASIEVRKLLIPEDNSSNLDQSPEGGDSHG